MTPTRRYTVMTFCTRKEGRPVRKSHITTYTTWANPAWPGCVTYEIEAARAVEAKEKAVELRLAEEGGVVG